jgi:hypothetical protein
MIVHGMSLAVAAIFRLLDQFARFGNRLKESGH